MELFLWNFQVALQFPDEIMRDAAQVAEKLGNATSQKIAILGDTSYGRFNFISLNSVLHKLFDRLTINMYSVYPFMTLMVVNCIYLSSNLYNNVKTYGFFLVLLLVRNGVIEQSLTGLKVFIYFR